MSHSVLYRLWCRQPTHYRVECLFQLVILYLHELRAMVTKTEFKGCVDGTQLEGTEEREGSRVSQDSPIFARLCKSFNGPHTSFSFIPSLCSLSSVFSLNQRFHRKRLQQESWSWSDCLSACQSARIVRLSAAAYSEFTKRLAVLTCLFSSFHAYLYVHKSVINQG